MAKTIPGVGDLVFTLSQNNFNDKIKVSTGLSYINALSYVSVDATKCMNVGYTDDTMTKVIINKDYKGPNGEDVSITMNVDDKIGRKRGSTDIFIDELEANAVAIEMNKQFREDCKNILDVISQVFHEYDNVIAALKSSKK
jgi:hypothetical protein